MAYQQDVQGINTSQLIQMTGQARQQSLSATAQLAQGLNLAIQPVVKEVNRQFNEDLKVREEIAIAKAVEDANISITPDQYALDVADPSTNDSVYESAYRKASLQKVESNISTLAREKLAESAAMYKDDLDGFKGSIDGIMSGIQSEHKLNGQNYAMLASAMSEETNRYLPSIASRSYERQKADQFAAIQQDYLSQQNIALNSLREGNVTQFQQDKSKLTVRLDQMIADGFITQQDKVTMIAEMEREAESQVVIGSVERTLDTGNVEAAISQIDEWKNAARKAGNMSPDQVDTELNRLHSMVSSKQREIKATQKTTLSAQKGLDIVTNGGGDYKNKGDVKSVDSFVSSQFPDGIDFGDPQQVQFVNEVATRSGIVPSIVESQVRKQLYNADPAMVSQGAATLINLINTNPVFIDQFSSSDVEYARDTQALYNSGVPVEQAVIMVKENRSLDSQTRLNYNLKQIGNTKDYASKTSKIVSSLVDQVGDVPFEFSQPMNTFFDADVSDEDLAYLTKDADVLFKTNLAKYATVEAAEEATKSQLENKWSVTYQDGKPSLQAYSPERVALKTTKFDSSNWVTQQKDALISNLREREVKGDIKFVPTAAAVQGVPIYTVMSFDEDQQLWKPVIVDNKPQVYMPNQSLYEKMVKEDQLNSARSKRKTIQKTESEVPTYKQTPQPNLPYYLQP